jgi:hypothetical protein
MKTAALESSLQEPDLGRARCPPVSLLAFLLEENLRLRTMVAELQQDTTVLRNTLRRN